MTTPVIQIDDRILTESDLLPLIVQYQLLPQFSRELVIDQAIAPISYTKEEATQACQKLYAAYQITDEAKLQMWLTQRRMTAAQLEQFAIRLLLIEKFKQVTWGNKVESHFLSCKSQLNRVVYSLLRNSDPGITQELYFRIKAGEDSFADLARQYSEGPEVETGGLLGPVTLSQPHPAIAEKLANSQPGQLLPPMRLGEWYLILRLEKLIPAHLDEETRQKLLNNLFETWMQEQIAQVQLLPQKPDVLSVASPDLAVPCGAS